MKYLPSIEYPDNEKPILASLEKLFGDWHRHFENNDSVLSRHNQVAKDMVFDGFCPHYFSQKKRILFIGREPTWIPGQNYIDILYPRYRVNKLVGDTPVNADKFHSRMIKIAYGILNGLPDWEKIEDAEKLGDTLGTEKGLSFACMNISKLSNNSGRWQTDWPVYYEAIRLSTEGRNFIEEEIAILKPHIVIAMNFDEKLCSLGKLSDSIHNSADVHSFWLESGDHRSLLIHSWHFSAPGKQDSRDYYEPIREAIQHSEALESGNRTNGRHEPAL